MVKRPAQAHWYRGQNVQVVINDDIYLRPGSSEPEGCNCLIESLAMSLSSSEAELHIPSNLIQKVRRHIEQRPQKGTNPVGK